MNVMSIDLELNQRDTGPKIIEIGCTIGHLPSRTIVERKSFLVNPNEEITEYINTLTGITQNNVANAPSLIDAYKQLCDWVRPFNIQKMPIEWGAGDVRALKNELNSSNAPYENIFGYTTMNVKNLVQADRIANGLSAQGGLKKSCSRYSVQWEGRAHRADWDSLNTLKLYYKMLDMLKEKKQNDR